MKFLRFVLLLFVATSIFFFVTFLNMKFIFSSSETAKKLLNESNLYPVAAAGIRDNIVKYAEVPVDQSKLIEVVNSAINETDLKNFVEDYTDQFYNVVNGKDKDQKITLHFGWLKEKVMTEIGGNKELAEAANMDNVLADREIDLSKNSFVKMLILLNDYLIGFGIAILVMTILWLGATFIVSGVAFIGELIIYYFGMSQKVLEMLAKESKLEDEKFLLGVQKLITAIVDFQKLYYSVITIGLIVLGIILIIVGKSLKKQDVGMAKI